MAVVCISTSGSKHDCVWRYNVTGTWYTMVQTCTHTPASTTITTQSYFLTVSNTPIISAHSQHVSCVYMQLQLTATL